MSVARYSSWKEVHNELLKQPFCHNRQQLARIIVCLDYINCRWEGLCYPCFKQGIKHKLLYTPPIENLPLLKVCSDTYDWHSAYNEIRLLERKHDRTHTHKKIIYNQFNICESNLMAAGLNNCQITEAIQNLPPELREIIYKHYLAIKLKEREALGWNLVHNELLIQPFCPEMERLVHILVCVAYMHCCCGGCCFPCYKQEEILHEITTPVPILDIT